MGKMFGILMIVLGVWIAAEVMTKGVAGAFGGLFAGPGAEAIEERPFGDASSSRYRNAMQQSEKRTERGIGE